MRPRVDLRIPAYTEARPRVFYAGLALPAPAPAFSNGRRAPKAPRGKRKAGLGKFGPAGAAAALIGWIVFAVPGVRTAALSAAHPALVAAGLAATASVIEIGQVHARRTEIDGQTLLYVEGVLVNKDKRAQKAPGLVVTIVGAEGQPLYAWKSRLAAKTIEGAQEAPFQTRLLSPPETYSGIRVALASE